MLITTIDPGPEFSAFVIWDTDRKTILSKSDPFKTAKGLKHATPNLELVDMLIYNDSERIIIEMIASYGMPVGREVFETCVWIGRFMQQAYADKTECLRVMRKDVKMCLCNSSRAKDGNVRQAIIDKFEPTGGGKKPQIGTKSQPGQLFGIAGDVWAALAIAVSYPDLVREGCLPE